MIARRNHPMRLISLGGFALLLALGIFLPARLASAQNDGLYVAPAGSAPPVAPPIRKGSPLDHLVNDPKFSTLPIGYHEGDTSGSFYYVAHRFIDDMDGQGWGWIRKSYDGWGDAQWFALQETLGVAVAPKRKLTTPTGDLNWEFKFWGKFAPYKAYDPRTNEQLPVFVLEGYEVIGPANPLTNKVGPPDRVEHRPSGASSREGRPILSDPGVD
jgi:hypothetical protein